MTDGSDRASVPSLLLPMPVARYDLYTLGPRTSMARLIYEELTGWASPDDSLIGSVSLDLIDRDYNWMIFGRDAAGRFRPIAGETSIETELEATLRLHARLEGLLLRAGRIADESVQGDEPRRPINVLTDARETTSEHRHPYFRELMERPAHAPARAVIKELGPWLAPADPHFVQEFQEKFDQRLWEMYLWAALRELGYDVEQLEAPDFLVSGPGVEFTVEATTVGPSQSGPLLPHPNPQTPEERDSFLRDYMPIKFASSLRSKLTKARADALHYWEREPARDKPFVLAVADFHKPADGHELGSMVYTQSALWQYLYGHRVQWELVDGVLVLKPESVASHTYGQKTILSAFFDQPEAEYISAVLFSNAGTISKFDRMGVKAGFGAAGHTYFRTGYRQDPDPNATHGIPFTVDVSDPGYDEGWSDELQVFHNPNAKNPLPRALFAGVTQHVFRNGHLYTSGPPRTVLSSYTLILGSTNQAR
jgi:hypothetical protein